MIKQTFGKNWVDFFFTEHGEICVAFDEFRLAKKRNASNVFVFPLLQHQILQLRASNCWRGKCLN